MNQTLLQTIETFKPLQPVSPAGGLVYSEYNPGPELAPYVYCFWELTSGGRVLHSYPYEVVADGTADVLFDLTQQVPPMLSVTNYAAFQIPLYGQIQISGIRFRPACIHYFFSLSLHKLTGQTVEAEAILGKVLCDLNDQLTEAPNLECRLQLLKAYLIQRLKNGIREIDQRFLRSLSHVLDSTGNARIKREVADIISSRQLRRMFDHYIGLGPKVFSRVVRFQQTMAAMQQAPAEVRSRLFFDYGYYDQAHFVREFKLFYGSTPGAAFSGR